MSTPTPPSSGAANGDVAAIVKKWKDKRGSLIMALHDLQDRCGYVPREQALELGKALGVPLARIYEVVTFYNYFKLKSPGKHIISVCTGTACHLKGAGKLIEKYTAELGIKEGGTTADGMFHLQGVRCLGCCGLAPVVTINGRVFGKLKPEDVPATIAAALKPEVA